MQSSIIIGLQKVLLNGAACPYLFQGGLTFHLDAHNTFN